MKELTSQSTNGSINQLISQPVNQSTFNQPINHSIPGQTMDCIALTHLDLTHRQAPQTQIRHFQQQCCCYYIISIKFWIWIFVIVFHVVAWLAPSMQEPTSCPSSEGIAHIAKTCGGVYLRPGYLILLDT